MLIAGRNGMAVKFPVTAKNYVQDGLIAMWDGIENAGWGVHDENATVWKDLIGDCDLTKYGNPEILYNGVNFSGNSCYYKWHSFGKVGQFDATVSINTKESTSYSVVSWLPGTYGYGYVCSNYGKQLALTIENIGDNHFTGKTRGSFSCSIIGRLTQYYNGNLYATTTREKSQLDTKSMCIGAQNYSLMRPFFGTVYNIRLYNRALTAAEVAANYAVDKIRFSLP